MWKRTGRELNLSIASPTPYHSATMQCACITRCTRLLYTIQLWGPPSHEVRTTLTSTMRITLTWSEVHPHINYEDHTHINCEVHPHINYEDHPHINCENHPHINYEVHPHINCEDHPYINYEDHPHINYEDHPHIKWHITAVMSSWKSVIYANFNASRDSVHSI